MIIRYFTEGKVISRYLVPRQLLIIRIYAIHLKQRNEEQTFTHTFLDKNHSLYRNDFTFHN